MTIISRYVAAMMAFVICTGGMLTAGEKSVKVVNLRCEYAVNPMGIDTVCPRLSWTLESTLRGQRQTAYHVLAASSKEMLQKNTGDLWDSGKVQSDASLHVEYKGKPLNSRMACFYKVRVWDMKGKPSAWSDVSQWTMGILGNDQWKGQWIQSDMELFDYQKELKQLPDHDMATEDKMWKQTSGIREKTAKVSESPCVWMRKEFASHKEVKRATVYICGLGFFELYLNGRKVQDSFFNTAVADYNKRLPYFVYDVTDLISRGDNAIGAILANGWFNPVIPSSLREYAADFIDTPRLLLELHMDYTDGTSACVVSDETWQFTLDGPIRFNSVRAGETYDARQELGDWTKPGYNQTSWKTALRAQTPPGVLCGQQLPPVRRLQQIPAVSVTQRGRGCRFDLGVETTGWARIKIRGTRGQKITIAYPGTDSHTLGRYQCCEYICKGSPEEYYEPQFSFNGFRFVDVEGLSDVPEASDVIGQMVCSDLVSCGEFSCSNKKLTELQAITRRTILNYVMQIPMDPVREKVGWTQDVQNGFEFNSYNFDTSLMYRKWQYDLLDSSQPNGYIPTVVPSCFDGPTINGPWWGGVIVYLPWELYRFYGDRRILEESFPAMKRYVGYLDSIASDNIIQWGLGDWMDIGSKGHGRPQLTTVPFTSTCAYYHYCKICEKTAGVLGRNTEAEFYAGKSQSIHDAIQARFFDSSTGVYDKGSQAAYIMVLELNIVPEAMRSQVIENLAQQIVSDNHHLSTGFVATPYLLTCLNQIGLGEMAYRIATQETYPSWFDMVFNQNNSVLKENWQGGLVQMPSLAGPISAWFYESLAGLSPDPSSQAFKKIIIKPAVENLDWVKCRYNSQYGTVHSDWVKENNVLTMHCDIPVNTTATICVPAENITESGKPVQNAKGITFLRKENGFHVFSVGSGRYCFQGELK